MNILSILLWSLALLFGIPAIITAVGLRLSKDMLKDSQTMKSVEFISISFDKLPWFVRMVLASKRTKLLNLKFTELSTFSRQGIGIPNFSTIMLSEDKLTIAELSYVRLGILSQVLLLFIAPSKFFIHLFGVYGLVFNSIFKTDNYRRFSTTKLKFLAEDSCPKEKEYCVTNKGVSMEEMLRIHSAGVSRITTLENLELIEFNTRESYFEFERFVLQRLSEKQRACVEENY